MSLLSPASMRNVVVGAAFLFFGTGLFAQTTQFTILPFAGAVRDIGDNGPATSALLNAPHGVTVDSSGNIYVVMVTADQSLEYQQNLKGRKLALVVLSTNHIGVLEKHPERLVAAVDAAREDGYEFVRFELPPKSKPGGSPSA